MRDYTPDESYVFALVAADALVVLAGDERLRASSDALDGFIITPYETATERALQLEISTRGPIVLRLEPRETSGHPWREGWALELEAVLPNGAKQSLGVLRPGEDLALVGPILAGELRASMRFGRRAIERTLGNRTVRVPLTDEAFYKHTRASSGQPRDAATARHWAVPTRVELAPYWELDLGQARYVARVSLTLADIPVGSRARISTFTYPDIHLEPPPGCFERVVELSQTNDAGRCVVELDLREVARFVRVTLLPPEGPASLWVLGASVLAAELFAETLWDTYERSLALFARRPLVLDRAEDDSGKAPWRYVPTLTYAEVHLEALSAASVLSAMVADLPMQERREPRARDRRTIGIALAGCATWIALDLACVHEGFIVLPLPPAPGATTREILELTKPDIIVSEPEELAAWQAELGNAGVVGARVLGRDELASRVEEAAPREARDPYPESALYTLLFTSGSTGSPKGAMRSFESFHKVLKDAATAQPCVHLAFQPLTHVSERTFIMIVFTSGGSIAFSRSTRSAPPQLMEELRALEPTVFSSVPRIFDVLYSTYERRKGALLAEGLDSAAADGAALSEARQTFGGRLFAIGVGSAPVSPTVFAFIKRCFADIWVTEGYGSTEVGTIAIDGRVRSNVDVKLKRAPNAGDEPSPRSSDDTERGELWVRSSHAIDGYFAVAATAFDEDGYFPTGDLGERDPDGRIRVVGRTRNTVKLAQGEFVSIEHVEGALVTAPVVDRVFVHASAGASSVSAVVLPQAEVLGAALGRVGAALAELVADARAEGVVRAALAEAARAAGLSAWEIPGAVLLTAVPFTAESGLLTDSGKLARKALRERFASQAPAELDEPGLAGDLARVSSTVLGRTVRADEALLSSGALDSLATAELLSAFRATLGLEVPLSIWFSARTLRDVADGLRAELRNDALQLARADMAVSVTTSELAPRAAPRKPLTVLLTGATGLVGKFILDAMTDPEGPVRAANEWTVYCLVRANDDEAARARLEVVMRALGRANDLSHVKVIAGDLGRARLGLSEARWCALAAELDAIVHAGAEVSWLASYAALREPNVLGTLSLLELAATARPKPLHFVSTISVVPRGGLEGDRLPFEALAGASPYVLSKWVAEEHVWRAFAAGLDGAIYRPSMVSGHSRRGAGNPRDFIHRYMAAVRDLGVYLDLEDEPFDMTPADFVAAAVSLSIADNPVGDRRALHLVNVDQSMSYAALGQSLVRAGVHARPVDYSEFRARLLERGSTTGLGALASFFPAQGFALRTTAYNVEATDARLAALGVRRPIIDDLTVAAALVSLST
ncbi:MAG: thioester reductase domain-containing protein [Polyangiaceae bacterium]